MSFAKKIEKEISVDVKNPLLVVSWDLVATHGPGYPVQSVIGKMDELGLPNEACEIRKTSAITRALREAAVGKSLVILQQNEQKWLFQITNISIEDDTRYGKIAKYLSETVITYLPDTGEIKCNNSKIKAYVVEKFVVCQENYKTNDITKILLRLFKKNSDIINGRRKGGFYMVPSAYRPFVDKVNELIVFLNPNNRFYVFSISGTKENIACAAPIIIGSKIEELKKFRHEIIEMEKSDAERITSGKKASSESAAKKDNRKKRLAEIKKKVSIWSRSLQVENEELQEVIRKCDNRFKRYFGA